MVSTADSDVEAVSVGGGRGQERCVWSSQGHTELWSPLLSPANEGVVTWLGGGIQST